MSTSHDTAPPTAVAWLGYGGLLPFAGLAIAAWIDRRTGAPWSPALLAYGATILSFVGALHWGVAMSAPALDAAQRQRAYMWSVVPALLAWVALLLPAMAGSVLMVAGFALHLRADHRLAPAAGLPAWYLPLRWRLTGVASVCVLLGTWAAGRAG